MFQVPKFVSRSRTALPWGRTSDRQVNATGDRSPLLHKSHSGGPKLSSKGQNLPRSYQEKIVDSTALDPLLRGGFGQIREFRRCLEPLRRAFDSFRFSSTHAWGSRDGL